LPDTRKRSAKRSASRCARVKNY